MLAASDHLLLLLSAPRSSIAHSIICPIVGNRLNLQYCAAYTVNVLFAFQQVLQRLESTVSALSIVADGMDDGLLQMALHLRSIRDLLSDEAGTVAAARDNILSDPLHMLGWNKQELRHYNTRMLAVGAVKSFRNTASAYVGAVRGRLRSVGKELEVLKRLSEESGVSDALPMVAIVHALRAGVVRVRDSQVALGGKELGDRAAHSQLAMITGN